MFAVRSALVMALQPGAQVAGFLEVLPGIWKPFLEPGYKPRTDGPIGDGSFRTVGRTMVMNERPEPDLDHVREAMRDHDERVHQDEAQEQPEPEDEDGTEQDEE
jgi:hypothetical protein